MVCWRGFAGATAFEVYFCDPRPPWQRGTNENTNGLVRQYFPKGTDFSAVSDAEVEAARDELNGRPRRTLGWMSSSEAMVGLLGSDMAGAIRVRSCFFVDRYRRTICP